MKRKILFFLLLLSLQCYSSKNEVITYLGKTSNQLHYQLGDVFQLKYERYFSEKISMQVGVRYHDELYWRNGFFNPDFLRIGSTYNSYKCDVTALLIPFNGERFKVKTGIGVDAASSLYTFATEGTRFYVETPEGVILKEFWTYSVKKIPDFGVHFCLVGSYYFKNNLFCSTQLLYNYVFNEEEFAPKILRQSPISLSLGVGFCF